ncbi:hypothetical protein BDQ17DRAFT_1412133 [Cyathus striatus]|nr:hypothetical protein BDQ17DRAFT_1412133 [Cyathus striatus]
MKIQEPCQYESVGHSVAASDGQVEGLHRVEQLPAKLVVKEKTPIGSDSITVFDHTGVKQLLVQPGMEQKFVGDNGGAASHLYPEGPEGAQVERVMEDNQHGRRNRPFVDVNPSKFDSHGHAKPAVHHPLSGDNFGNLNGELKVNRGSNGSSPQAECMQSISGTCQIPATTGGEIVNSNVVDISQHQNTAESRVISVIYDSWSTTSEARFLAVSSETRSAVAESEQEPGADEASDNQAYRTLITTNNALVFVAGLCSLLAAFQPLVKLKSPVAGWIMMAFAICAALIFLILLFMRLRGEWLDVARQQRDRADRTL